MIPFQIVMYDLHTKISSYRCGCVYNTVHECFLYYDVFIILKGWQAILLKQAEKPNQWSLGKVGS